MSSPNISTFRASATAPSINFTWSPIGSLLTYTLAGNSYPPAGTRFEAFFTPVNQVITFVAQVVMPPGINAVEHHWNLGDGTIKYGSTTTHTYRIPNTSLSVTLRVTDSLGHIGAVQKIILLQPLSPTIAKDHVRVS